MSAAPARRWPVVSELVAYRPQFREQVLLGCSAEPRQATGSSCAGLGSHGPPDGGQVPLPPADGALGRVEQEFGELHQIAVPGTGVDDLPGLLYLGVRLVGPGPVAVEVRERGRQGPAGAAGE